MRGIQVLTSLHQESMMPTQTNGRTTKLKCKWRRSDASGFSYTSDDQDDFSVAAGSHQPVVQHGIDSSIFGQHTNNGWPHLCDSQSCACEIRWFRSTTLVPHTCSYPLPYLCSMYEKSSRSNLNVFFHSAPCSGVKCCEAYVTALLYSTPVPVRAASYSGWRVGHDSTVD